MILRRGQIIIYNIDLMLMANECQEESQKRTDFFERQYTRVGPVDMEKAVILVHQDPLLGNRFGLQSSYR